VSLCEAHQVLKRYGGGPTEVHAVHDIDLPVDAGARIRMTLAMGRGQSEVRCAGAACLSMVLP
jgi:hypothetical protein